MKQLLVIFILAFAITWAGSQGGATYAGIPIFVWYSLLVFFIQWFAFIPAFLLQTEVFYDLTGSITYISAVLLALLVAPEISERAVVLALLIAIWASRLGSFLFSRILTDGGDSRFEKIKPSPMRFFVTWNLQGLWVFLTAACALAAITAVDSRSLSYWDLLGLSVWLLGFGFEVIADRQKRKFRNTQGSGNFINTGLWALSRHPNYFGEVVLWLGIAILAFPALEGWRYLTLISPLFVFLLLTRVSGVPLLERKADSTWGDNPEYQAYKAATPIFIPRLPIDR